MNHYIIPGLKKHNVTEQKIIEAVIKRYGITKVQLFMPCRQRFIVFPRMICFLLLRRHTRLTVEAIGKMFSKNHTTVLHGLQTIQDLNPVEDIRILENEIGIMDMTNFYKKVKKIN